MTGHDDWWTCECLTEEEHIMKIGIEDVVTPSKDVVNHPSHYTAHPSGIECIDVTEHMSFNLGNAVKYIWRVGLKDPDWRVDLEKAVWYINREIERLEKEN